MSAISAGAPATAIPRLPTHLDLPDTDGKPVDNTYQPIQWAIFLNSIRAHMDRLRPDGQYLAAADHGIYWLLTNPPLNGAKAPDFMIVEGVPPVLPDSLYRRSYVLWQERVPPTFLIELVSGDGREERDRTPQTGKFWIYENAIQARYYAIYDPENETIELYELTGGRYQTVPVNERGRYPVAGLRLELGTMRYAFAGVEVAWLRFFDADGNLLLTGEERAEHETRRAEQETRRAEQEKQRAEQEKQRADKLAEKLRQLGIDPNDP
jgi:Uma2 family endonuclease